MENQTLKVGLLSYDILDLFLFQRFIAPSRAQIKLLHFAYK